MDAMKIRLAQENDKPGILPYDRHIPLAGMEECIRNHRLYVLCAGEQIVGVLRYSLFWQTIPFLDFLYIHEEYRKKGYGRQMMAHWESELRSMTYRYGMLSTQENETAKYFYEKLGYRRVGAFLPPEQEADEIMYVKEL